MLDPGSQGGHRQVDTSSRNDHLSRGWTTQMPPLLQAHREVRSSVRNQMQRAPAWPTLATYAATSMVRKDPTNA